MLAVWGSALTRHHHTLVRPARPRRFVLSVERCSIWCNLRSSYRRRRIGPDPIGAAPSLGLTQRRSWLHSCCVDENEVAGSATYQSVERVLALLTSFDESRTELSVTEIASLLGVHKSTASRLAATLARDRLLA